MGACRSVDPHTGGLVGDDRRAEGEIDAKSVVLVELAGPIVPPREFRGVGVAITGEVGEPEFEQPSDGIAFGWAGVGSPSPARRISWRAIAWPGHCFVFDNSRLAGDFGGGFRVCDTG